MKLSFSRNQHLQNQQPAVPLGAKPVDRHQLLTIQALQNQQQEPNKPAKLTTPRCRVVLDKTFCCERDCVRDQLWYFRPLLSFIYLLSVFSLAQSLQLLFWESVQPIDYLSVGYAWNAYFPRAMSNCVPCNGVFVLSFFKEMFN